ncbi:winged helix-turn-helix transcriptional regulator [candidate division WOR-3 bacterium]|nr:winged helix-turn-helix transcriptional regulator [candidate division WOR-3 bacterium]
MNTIDSLEQVIMDFSGLLDLFESDFMKNRKTNDLTIKQLLYLSLIETMPLCTTTAISKKLQVKKPTVSNLISVLEIKDLVRKRLSNEDARIHLIEITVKGKNLLATRKKLHRDFASKILNCLNESEKAQSLKLMKKIYDCNKELLK